MKITLVQMNVTSSLETNKEKIIKAIANARQGEWIIFPECSLTGYFLENEDFLKQLNASEVTSAINDIVKAVEERQIFCLFGTARYAENNWYNSVVIVASDGSIKYFDKIALSQLDEKHFKKGTNLDVFTMGNITFGVLICRELVFPEMWKELKAKGAQIIFHINNAIKPYDAVWEHIVIARAVENQVFVASSNNAAAPAELASYLVEPSGNVLVKTKKQVEQSISAEIDLVNFISPY